MKQMAVTMRNSDPEPLGPAEPPVDPRPTDNLSISGPNRAGPSRAMHGATADIKRASPLSKPSDSICGGRKGNIQPTPERKQKSTHFSVMRFLFTHCFILMIFLKYLQLAGKVLYNILNSLIK